MKCANHPKRDAVAVLHNERYNSSFGACDECYKEYKRKINSINNLG